MLDFRKPVLSDKEWVDSLTKLSDFRRSEDSFTTLFIWSDVYNSKICRYKDFVVVRSTDELNAYYIYPPGRGDIKELLTLLMEDAEKINKKFNLLSIPTNLREIVEEAFPSLFLFSSDRNSFDYIYLRESLATLSGKKLQSKRNHISRFKDNKNFSFESFSWENPEKAATLLEECKIMNDLWCKENNCTHYLSLYNETCAVKNALKNFLALKLYGGILRIDERIVAYTIGEPLNSDTFIIHIEKAFSSINGAYPMINQAFIIDKTADFKYINREDDAGDEDLRRAKLSYNPIFMEEKLGASKK